ncbi:MFS transporter [Actinomadura sp. PM05-2]|uniref:MFS transporter n=1 Tax=Actinomadura parmotrematis TaxID=2864039 RepID=A0ABS7G462_9ACTN|nr:MFS transporter [Actinomadura parmotrematis]
MPAGPPEERPSRNAWWSLAVVSLASVLIGLGGNALNVALPAVVRHFRASPLAANWMLLSFMLASTVLIVVFGRFADMFGRRAMYLAGLAAYTAASLLLGLAPTAWTLVALRVLQAAGGAMLLANSAAILTEVFPRPHLGRAMGVYTAGFSIAQLAGPTLGGFLVETYGWRWVFWYNVPVGAACLALGAAVLRPDRRAAGERGLDVPGNLLILAGLGGLLFGLSQANDRGWGSPVVLGGVLVFAVLLPVFARVERRARHPVVDLALFRDRPFALGLLASFLNATARVGAVVIMALFFQSVQGEDAVAAGLKVLPMSAVAVVASTGAGFLDRRVGARTMAAAATALTALGLLALLATVSADAGYAPIAGALMLLGAGSGAFLPANATALLDGLPARRLGIVNAMRLMVMNAGIVLSTGLSLSLVAAPVPAALRGAVFAGTLPRVAPDRVPLLVTGYRYALGGLAVLALLALAACLASRRAARDRDRRRPERSVVDAPGPGAAA